MADIVKREGLFRRASFTLHYFPTIPVQEAAEEAVAEPVRETFQRMELGRSETRLVPDVDICPPGGAEDAAPSQLEELQSRHLAEVADAYRQGFTEGERVGRAAGRGEVEAQTQRLGGALQELDTLSGRLQAAAEAQAVALALAVARKVMADECAGRAEAVAGMVRAALRRVADRRQIRVRVHPQDLEALQRSLPRFAELAGKWERIRLEADPAVSQGGVIQTEFGEIDARLETQLAAIGELFAEQSIAPAGANAMVAAEPAGEGHERRA